MKIKANIDLLQAYSTLNPDTSSDFPSAKQNGVRCVSAKIEIIHDKDNGINITIVQV